MRNCRYLKSLRFDCCDWSACVASDSWGKLDVPPPEMVAHGTPGVFEFVRAPFNGGAVCVCGMTFALNASAIDLRCRRSRVFDELLLFLESFRQGKFSRMERLYLVMPHRDRL
jgi:hypothetical protein